jgi:hypothetical protein
MRMQQLRSSSKLAQLAKLSNLLLSFVKTPASASLQGFFTPNQQPVFHFYRTD